MSCNSGTPDKPSQYFLGFMAYNRFWFHKDLFALTLGGGAITNPGRYLVLIPPINGATAFSGTPYFSAAPGDKFRAWDTSATFDYMPTQFSTFRIEYNHRASNVPYFSGEGGVTPRVATPAHPARLSRASRRIFASTSEGSRLRCSSNCDPDAEKTRTGDAMRIMKCLQAKLAECAEAPGASALTPYCGSIVRRIARVFPVGVIVFASTAGVKAQSHSVAGQASRASNEIGHTVASKSIDSSKQKRKETLNTSALIEGLLRMPDAIEPLDGIEKLERRLGESPTAMNTPDGSSRTNRAAEEASSPASNDEGAALAQNEPRPAAPSTSAFNQKEASSKPPWQYGGFVDLGYLLDYNHPANRIFRSRGTAWHVDRLFLNMAGVYAKKKASEQSRWGVEMTAQGGKDSELFGFSATAPNIDGFTWLRHIGPTNVSYLAPAGKGLTLQGGIFASLIGYDSLYAKDNFNYTRPWGADFTPYLMMGMNASYAFNERLTGTFFVVNGYWHLANANSVPSSGGQLAYKASPRVTVKETVLWGPHQTDTSLKYWRSLSDTIVEHKGDRVTFAFEYIYSSERVVAPGNPRALMMSGQLPIHYTINKRWSASVRPEVFWDRDGRWTLARQTVKAVTTTLEYHIPYKETNTILRLEHRWDDSRGPDGGFFRGGKVLPGVLGLTPTQHLLVFGLMFTFDR